MARGEHTELHRALAAAGAAGGAEDPWLPLVSAQLRLVDGDLRGARAETARADAMGGRAGDSASASFRAATRQLSRDGRLGSRRRRPAGRPGPRRARARRGGGRRISADAAGAPTDPAAVLSGLEQALATARDQHFGLLEVQCLCLLGAVASAELGPPTRGRGRGRGDDRGGRPRLAGIVVDRDRLRRAGPLLPHARRPGARAGGECRGTADGARIAGSRPPLRPARGPRRGTVRPGDRARGLLELQEAQAELGGTPLPGGMAGSGRAARAPGGTAPGSAAAAATSKGRIAAGGSAAAELALLDAWAVAAASCPAQARSAVLPLLEGRLRPVLPSTVVEAWLLEVWGALRTGDRPAARQALQNALALAEPMDTLRPFALAGQGLRVLLVDQLNGDRDPAAFAFRCLTARQRVQQVTGTGAERS